MGKLITIEGGEFVGKTSLAVPALKKILETAGIEVRVSREPGGTPEGEKIRLTIFKRLSEGAPTEEIMLLFNKARQIHLETVIIPFLGQHKEKRRVVILDRYLDTMRVLQGLEGGIPLQKLKDLENTYVKGYYPDCTMILHFPEETFAQTFTERKNLHEHSQKSNRDKTEWDKGDINKQLERQRFYLQLPQIAETWKENRAFKVIDASVTPGEVAHQLAVACEPILKHDMSIVKSLKKPLDLNSTYHTLKKQGVWKTFPLE